MIKNIIFDLGNVLLDFKPEEYLRKKYQDVDLIKRLYQEVFQSPEWILLDKGILEQGEVVQRLSIRYPEDAEKIAEVFQNWMEMLSPIPGTVEILKDLEEQGYMLYVLSNYHLKAFERVFRENYFFKYFDGMMISAEVKMIKPDSDIYQELIKRYNLVPEESIFIDDTEENINGGKKVGIKTIHFTSPDRLRRKLKKFKVEV